MLIYDIEIIKAIPPRNPIERLDDIDYCTGWHDCIGMGVSVIGCYDYRDDRYRVFLKDNFDEFRDLVHGSPVVIGFNNAKFDNAVLKACGIVDIWEEKTYDILQEIWAANGGRFSPSGLDAVCQVNFGTSKTGNGALAPVDWQRGNYGKVIDYCMNDARMTKQIMDLVLSGASVISPKDGTLLNLRRPIIEKAA
jgi:DNA polymerase III epsilon subunit-like protein